MIKPAWFWLVKQEGRYLRELHVSKPTLGSGWSDRQSEAIAFDTRRWARAIAKQLAPAAGWPARVVRVRAR